MSDECLMSRRLDHEVNVGRSPGVTSLSFQHLSDGTVIWNRVGRRFDRPEVEPAILVGTKAGAHRQVADLIELLYIVIAVVVRMPDIDGSTRQRLTIG